MEQDRQSQDHGTTEVDHLEVDPVIEELQQRLDSMEAELNQEREKVALLMQPKPKDLGEFPWQMMRLWTQTYKEEKQLHRAKVGDLKGLLKAGYEVLHELVAIDPDVCPETKQWLYDVRKALDE